MKLVVNEKMHEREVMITVQKAKQPKRISAAQCLRCHEGQSLSVVLHYAATAALYQEKNSNTG